MRARAIGDRVIVKLIQTDNVSSGGIALPDNAVEKPQKGTIVSVGEGKRETSAVGTSRMSVSVGEVVIFGKYWEYVRAGVTTNGIESVWAVMKRGLHGVYHHASRKHLGRYVNEFAFRLNEGNVKARTLSRLDAMIAASAGKRITYKELTQCPVQ